MLTIFEVGEAYRAKHGISAPLQRAELRDGKLTLQFEREAHALGRKDLSHLMRCQSVVFGRFGKTECVCGIGEKSGYVFLPFSAVIVTCEVDWDLSDEEEEVEGPSRLYRLTMTADTLRKIGGLTEHGDKWKIDEDILYDYLADALSDDSGWCHTGFAVTGVTPFL